MYHYTVRACHPLGVEVTFQPEGADGIVHQFVNWKVDHAAIITHSRTIATHEPGWLANHMVAAMKEVFGDKTPITADMYVAETWKKEG